KLLPNQPVTLCNIFLCLIRVARAKIGCRCQVSSQGYLHLHVASTSEARVPRVLLTAAHVSNASCQYPRSNPQQLSILIL
ncbi:hypothetical protein EV401DRAFT_2000275, partial [Pisolithus croceorrhizus]